MEPEYKPEVTPGALHVDTQQIHKRVPTNSWKSLQEKVGKINVVMSET